MNPPFHGVYKDTAHRHSTWYRDCNVDPLSPVPPEVGSCIIFMTAAVLPSGKWISIADGFSLRLVPEPPHLVNGWLLTTQPNLVPNIGHGGGGGVDSKASGLLDCLWITSLPTLYMSFILKVGIIIVAVNQRILKSQLVSIKCLAQGWATRRNSTIAGSCNQNKGG